MTRRFLENLSLQDVELDLANILKGFAFWGINMENMKLKLAENPHFDIQHVWNQLDKQNRGYIQTEQLQSFLSANRIASSQRETEMLISLYSSQKGKMDFGSLIEQCLPSTNQTMREYAINRKEIKRNQKVQQYQSEIMVGAFSECKVAELLGEELKFYRELEELKSEFKQKYNLTTNQIYSIVNSENSNEINFEVLKNFLKKTGHDFSVDEYQAFLWKTTNDMDSKLDFDELINAIVPKEPYDYPSYRKEFDGFQNKVAFINKAHEFEVKVSPYSFGKVPPKERVNPRDYHYPLRNVYDPYKNGKDAYFNDKGYLAQQKDYKTIYFNPNKDYSFTYKNEGNKGVRYHDSFYDKFYNYMYDQDRNEKYFNKFGKRFCPEDKFLGKENFGLISQNNNTDINQSNSIYNNTVRFENQGNSNLQNTIQDNKKTQQFSGYNDIYEEDFENY
ncbi:hypothetical protein PPERSA_11627 [Pseudocohnilembus persalinus]|uniref:EF-hand domain-containing protein n=1 Tax=Pseudocohnilembus persalinus TaxID=266149 RepID=A0A0V0Q9Z8_PSEPJ|nr:hypothetical protein PPERSA_11627 [Pseudocohnilembus persalinus]|eukprot:KRW99026.1 hypothetical protein PPERSA_11627 [Pseudocohnilembus persalinus]